MVITNDNINMLVVIFVMGGQSAQLVHLMRQSEFRFTEVDSSGGFLQEPTTCFFVGINSERLDAFLELVHSVCHKRLQYIPARMDVAALQGQPIMMEAEMGGAIIFAFEVEQFIQAM